LGGVDNYDIHWCPRRRLDISDRSSDRHENHELKQCGLNLCPIDPLPNPIHTPRPIAQTNTLL
jgi:hypothetical protein